ncbi:DNA adenine methylase, partial [Salmonella enterica subsp. enterica serovar Montevideo]|nr:DNA adenine methylase [Salmonella enterica subsp. enterica serovar Montevideo]
ICASYDETLALLQTGDVVYCDPPYDGTFNGYHTAGFTENDQYLNIVETTAAIALGATENNHVNTNGSADIALALPPGPIAQS